ncbi:MAG: L,D-transpeptidase [Eubacterium sp.]
MGKISINKKKIKNIMVPIIQLLIIGGLILGVVYYALSKLPGNSVSISHGNVSGLQQQDSDNDNSDSDTPEQSNEYLIVVNASQQVVIIYQYSKDGKDKNAVKVFNCSTGSKIKKGTYKIKDKYSWLSANGIYWNQYNSRYDESCWFQSVNYFAPYHSYISTDSYNALGSKQEKGGCVKLTVGDAKWIFDNCPEGTKVKVIKNKNSKLPLEPSNPGTIPGYAGWDPSDPAEGNPWNFAENAKISVTSENVYVERGAGINYLANVIARDEEGNDITRDLSYKKLATTNECGEYKVKYTYKDSNGQKYKATVTYSIQDSLGPSISLSANTDDYEYKVSTKKEKKINTEDVQDEIINKVKKLVSSIDVDEVMSGSNIEVILPETLKIGNNIVKVAVTDNYGNVSRARLTIVIVYEKEDKSETNKTEEETTKKSSKETTTKSTENTTTKKNSSKKEEDTTTKSSVETTTKAETTTQAETTEPESELNTEQDTTNDSEQSAGD